MGREECEEAWWRGGCGKGGCEKGGMSEGGATRSRTTAWLSVAYVQPYSNQQMALLH